MSATIKFKDYEWPYNPSKLKIEQQKNLSQIDLPFVGTIIQNLNCGKKIISGSGEFFGEDCFEKYNKLNLAYKENSSGYLSIPEIGTFLVEFKKLNISCDPGPKSVAYYFEFWETLNTQTTKEALVANYHIVKNSETVFDIAKMYNKTTAEIFKLNPNIKRPDDIKPGDKVMLR